MNDAQYLAICEVIDSAKDGEHDTDEYAAAILVIVEGGPLVRLLVRA
jgi:hypothetical protein